MNVDKYIGKRIYDYFDNNGKRDDFDKVVEFLNTSDDFQMFNKDYVNLLFWIQSQILMIWVNQVMCQIMICS